MIRDQRGAAAVEFVVAMVPLFLVLFCFLQLGKLYVANLALHHAAFVAARAAAVIVNPDVNPGNNGSDGDVSTVARLALGAFQGSFSDVEAKVESEASSQAPSGMVTTTVTGTFRCGVALGATITCGADRSVNVEASARFPLQGARYKIAQGAGARTPIGALAGSPNTTVCDPRSPFSVCAP